MSQADAPLLGRLERTSGVVAALACELADLHDEEVGVAGLAEHRHHGGMPDGRNLVEMRQVPGDDDDGDLREPVVTLQDSEQLPTGQFGHLQVENNEARLRDTGGRK